MVAAQADDFGCGRIDGALEGHDIVRAQRGGNAVDAGLEGLEFGRGQVGKGAAGAAGRDVDEKLVGGEIATRVVLGAGRRGGGGDRDGGRDSDGEGDGAEGRSGSGS